MHRSGFAGRVADRPEESESGSFWVTLSELHLHGPVLVTTFTAPNREVVSFTCQRAKIDALLPTLKADIESSLRTSLSKEEICNNLHDVGRRLTDCLLVCHPHSDTRKNRIRLANLFRKFADSDLQCQVHLPIPLELLLFDKPVAGVGPFARMIGGRPNIYYASPWRPGRATGRGASFFHDHTAETVSKGQALAAVQSAFGLSVEKHVDLEYLKLKEATNEIDRLFKNGKSAWAHFQCHVEYPPEQPRNKKLQLTRHFLATTDRFSSASTALSGIFLNGCGATNFLSGQPDLQSSWSEYFMSECFVPSVIGPFCAVLDPDTLPFTQAFYASLASNGSAYASFVSARRERLEAGDCTALTYRYVGPVTLRVPLASSVSQLDFFDLESR
ncbi:hypothetical protein [Bradyrhizobium sp. USDA 4353]